MGNTSDISESYLNETQTLWQLDNSCNIASHSSCLLLKVTEYKSFSSVPHSQLTSETTVTFSVLTAKHFHPQESDEDFASRSDNDQNQVKLMC